MFAKIKNSVFRFAKEKKAQISAEMIIVMAALLGIAILLITKLTKTAKDSTNTLGKKSDKLLTQIDKIDDVGGDGNSTN